MPSPLKNELPAHIIVMLENLDAPPRLIAHLQLVHDGAVQLTEGLDESFPNLNYNREEVLIGAATHDIGKIIYPDELTQSGDQHENAGVGLLIQQGFTDDQARFARTHGKWQTTEQLDDLLVTLADKIWKGARVEALEMNVTEQIARQCQQEARGFTGECAPSTADGNHFGIAGFDDRCGSDAGPWLA